MNAATVIKYVQIGMGISLIFFYLAYFLRHRNKKLHVVAASCGVIANLLAAGFLVYHVRVLGIVIPSDFSPIVVTIHRILASLVAVLMLLMMYWGLSRKLKWHRRFHLVFLISYTCIFISGWVLFVN